MPKYPDVHLHAVRDDVQERARAFGRVFRRSDLVMWDLPADTVVPMLRRGWWTRLHHGVYADSRDASAAVDSRDGHLLRVAASIRALPDSAYAFGFSAALLHDPTLRMDPAQGVRLVRHLGRDGRSLSRRISAADRLTPARMTTYQLKPGDVQIVQGIPTVTRSLAAVSAAAGCSPDWAVSLLDAAAWGAPERIDEMRKHAAQLQHLAGIGVTRSALPLVRSGAQTPLETHSRLRLVRCGLPEPRLQVPFYDEQGLIGIVDMYFEELGVIGEADGMLKYRTGDDLLAEKRREDRLRRRRPLVRWDWTEMWTDPAGVAGRIREAASWLRAG